MLLLAIHFCYYLLAAAQTTESSLEGLPQWRTVNVSEGALRGRLVQSRAPHEKYYYSFQGIPYAEPPVGDLRFKAPRNPESWEGVRDAFEEGPVCIQPSGTDVIGSEDCLFLNVYVPARPEELGNASLSVMVFVHGGAMTWGSGNTDIYGPDYFVDSGIVLVTLNYRLAALGFLSLDSDQVSGNNGLKDVVAALRWVRRNIEAFNANPWAITVFGQGSGGAFVEYLMISPMTQGLLQYAISESGSVLNQGTYINSTVHRAFQLGAELGLKTENSTELLQLLKNITAEDIVRHQDTR